METTPTRRALATTPRRPDLLAAEHDLDGIPPGAVPERSGGRAADAALARVPPRRLRRRAAPSPLRGQRRLRPGAALAAAPQAPQPVAGLKQLTAERIDLIVTTIAPDPTFVLVRGGRSPEDDFLGAVGLLSRTGR
jgi:hypothetical protein